MSADPDRRFLMRRAKLEHMTVLIPVSADAHGELARLKEEERVWVKLDRQRSDRQVRFFHALVKHVAEATAYQTMAALKVDIKFHLGYFDLIKLPNGEIHKHPRSIADMGREEFSIFFDEAVAWIFAEVLPGEENTGLLAEIYAMLEPETHEEPSR
jgi:hypothetical protein